jgi:hypothetical protein
MQRRIGFAKGGLMERLFRALAAVTFILAGSIGGVEKANAQYACGGTIGPNAGVVTATMDLACMTGATALTVVGPGTTLDLDGFSIDCATNVCLQISGEKAVVKNGFLSGATDDAVVVGGTGKHKIENVVAEFSSDDGFSVMSPKNKFINCVAANNGNDGFFVAIGGNKIDSCTASSNIDDGFVFGDIGDKVIRSTAYLNGGDGFDSIFGPTKLSLCVAADNFDNGFEIGGLKSKLVKNIAMGNNTASGFAGFFIAANACTLVKNIADEGVAQGFLVTGDFNKLSKNRSTSNFTSGIQLGMTADSNTITGNTAMRNLGMDLLESGSCATNKWSKNVFRTSTDPCIQ